MIQARTNLLISYSGIRIQEKMWPFTLDTGTAEWGEVKALWLFDTLDEPEAIGEVLADMRLFATFGQIWAIIYPESKHEMIVELVKTGILETEEIQLLEESDEQAQSSLVETLRNNLAGMLVGGTGKKRNLGKLSFKILNISAKEEEMTREKVLEEYKNLSDKDQQAILEEIQGPLPSTGRTAARQLGKRLTNRMANVAEKIASGASTEEIVRTILKGLVRTFGKEEKLAVMICGFDESRPRYHQFDSSTYFFDGTDKVRLEEMQSHGPPRPGKKTGSSIYTMEHRRPIYINDLRRPPRDGAEISIMMDKRLKSLSSMPLMMGTERVGIIQLQFSTRHTFSTDEKAEIGAYAQMAANILHIVQLQRQLTEEKNNVEQLKELIRDVVGAERSKASQAELLDKVCTHLEATRATDFYIAFYNSENNRIEFQRLYWDDAFQDVSRYSSFPKSSPGGLLEYVLDTAETLFIPANLLEAIQEIPQIARDPRNPPPKCYLGVPIKQADKVYGIIAVQDFNQDNRFNPSDRAVLEGLAILLSKSFL